MNFVQDVTQKLNVNISKEDTAKVPINFGDAGRQLGGLIAQTQQTPVQQEETQDFSRGLALSLQVPDLSQLQTAAEVEDMSLQYRQKLESYMQGLNNGSISDTEFQSKVSAATTQVFNQGLNVKDIASIQTGIPGFKDMSKSVNVSDFLSVREGKNKAIEESTKENTKKDYETGLQWSGRTDLSPGEYIRIGKAVRQREMNIQYANEYSNKTGDREVLDIPVRAYFTEYVSKVANKLWSEMSPAQAYMTLQNVVHEEQLRLGATSEVANEVVTGILKAYKDMSVEDVAAISMYNESRTEDQKTMYLNFMKQLPPKLRNNVMLAQYTNTSLQHLPGAMEALIKYEQEGRDALTASQTIELGKAFILKEGHTLSKQQDEEAQVTNKSVNLMTSQDDPKSAQTNSKNSGPIFDYYTNKIDGNNLTPETRQESIRAVSGLVRQMLAAVKGQLDPSFSVGVSSSGNYVALHNGKPYTASSLGKLLSTDGAVLLDTVGRMNRAQGAFDNLQATPQDRLKAISNVNFTGATAGDIVQPVVEIPAKMASAVVQKGSELIGREDLGRWYSNVAQEFAAGAKEGIDRLTGTGAPQQHKLLGSYNPMQEFETGLKDISAEDFLKAVRAYRGITEETTTESFGGDEIMSAALETEPDEIEAKIDYSKRPPIVDNDALYDKMGGKYKGSLAKKGEIPKGTSLLTGGRKPISSDQVEKQKKFFTNRVESIKTALDEGRDTMQVQLLYDGKPQTVTVPTALALTAIGEGFSSKLTKDNTIGFGTKKFVAEPILKRMGIELTEKTVLDPETAAKVAMVYLVGVPSVKGDSEEFKALNGAVDNKLRKVFGKDFDKGKDPVRVMLARDLLFGFGPSSVNLTDYKKVGLDKYLIRVMNDATIAEDILPYVPTFPPFKGTRNGDPYNFPSPFGASRIALMELLIDDVMPSDKG
jgi:hypothetical protein